MANNEDKQIQCEECGHIYLESEKAIPDRKEDDISIMMCCPDCPKCAIIFFKKHIFEPVMSNFYAHQLSRRKTTRLHLKTRNQKSIIRLVEIK